MVKPIWYVTVEAQVVGGIVPKGLAMRTRSYFYDARDS